MKVCTRCLEEKPLAAFYRAKNGSPRARCIDCTKAVYLAYQRTKPEAIAEKNRRWRATAVRRPRLRGAESHAYARIILRDPCSYCGAPAEHVDHIEPLARGGANAWDNLTPACATCNVAKRDTPLLLWLVR